MTNISVESEKPNTVSSCRHEEYLSVFFPLYVLFFIHLHNLWPYKMYKFPDSFFLIYVQTNLYRQNSGPEEMSQRKIL